MAFCPTCKRDYDPGLNCLDGTTQTLRNIGIENSSKTSKEEFRKINKSANKTMLIVLLFFVLGIALFFFLKLRR